MLDLRNEVEMKGSMSSRKIFLDHRNTQDTIRTFAFPEWKERIGCIKERNGSLPTGEIGRSPVTSRMNMPASNKLLSNEPYCI